jgi:hypothetical protein
MSVSISVSCNIVHKPIQLTPLVSGVEPDVILMNFRDGIDMLSACKIAWMSCLTDALCCSSEMINQAVRGIVNMPMPLRTAWPRGFRWIARIEFHPKPPIAPRAATRKPGRKGLRSSNCVGHAGNASCKPSHSRGNVTKPIMSA